MAEIYCDGLKSNTSSELVEIGEQAPDFLLTASDLSMVSLSDLKNQPLLINVYPSIETYTCNESCKLLDTKNQEKYNIIGVSMDLPFTLAHLQKEFEHVCFLSDFRTRAFGRDYGVTIVNGPLAGLLARAVIVLDSSHCVTYYELCKDIVDMPDTNAAFEVLKECTEG